MRKIYPALISVDPNGKYIVRVPDIPGCMTTGRSTEEVFELIRDALAGCICTLEDVNEPVPEPSEIENVKHDPTEFIALIDVDTLAYREATETKAVRKNVSMPAWLSNMADKKGLNCSQILQDALKKQLELVY